MEVEKSAVIRLSRVRMYTLTQSFFTGPTVHNTRQQFVFPKN